MKRTRLDVLDSLYNELNEDEDYYETFLDDDDEELSRQKFRIFHMKNLIFESRQKELEKQKQRKLHRRQKILEMTNHSRTSQNRLTECSKSVQNQSNSNKKVIDKMFKVKKYKNTENQFQIVHEDGSSRIVTSKTIFMIINNFNKLLKGKNNSIFEQLNNIEFLQTHMSSHNGLNIERRK